jgi:nicotinamide riboside transporter PnuC
MLDFGHGLLSKSFYFIIFFQIQLYHPLSCVLSVDMLSSNLSGKYES